MKALLVSSDPAVRDMMAVTARSARRTLGEPIEIIEASDGLIGTRLAWSQLPDIVVADEITSRAGAFALAKELTGAFRPFPGRIVILLERPHDAWLARWSGADAWFVKPANPFEVADVITGFFPREGRRAG